MSGIHFFSIMETSLDRKSRILSNQFRLDWLWGALEVSNGILALENGNSESKRRRQEIAVWKNGNQIETLRKYYFWFRDPQQITLKSVLFEKDKKIKIKWCWLINGQFWALILNTRVKFKNICTKILLKQPDFLPKFYVLHCYNCTLIVV